MAILEVLKYALSIGDSLLSRRYLKRVIELESEYYEEENKPELERRHSVMDNINAELCLISKSLTNIKK